MAKLKDKIKKSIHDKAFYKGANLRRKNNHNMNRTLDLKGKNAVIFGVATDKSIACGPGLTAMPEYRLA